MLGAHAPRIFRRLGATQIPNGQAGAGSIAAIYAIEARAAFAPIAERIEQRRELAHLLDDIFAWARATLAKLSAKSNLAEALRYAINRREALSRFVTDGRQNST